MLGYAAGILGLVIAFIAYINLKPGIDILAFITPPALALIPIAYEIGSRIRVDITPIASTPLAYTLYYIATTYMKQPGDIITLAYTITLSASITLITTTTLIVAWRR